MRLNRPIPVFEKISRFITMNNRLVFYVSLQLLFVVFIILVLPNLLYLHFWENLTQHQPIGHFLTPEQFRSEFEQFWSQVIPVRILCLVLGILLAVYMARAITKPIVRLARKSQAILDGDINVSIEEVLPSDELSILNNTISRMVQRLLDSNANLERVVEDRTRALLEANRQLKEKEDTLIARNEQLQIKENLLTIHNEELAAQEEELTEYINRLSEKQEENRIVKWIVTSIRESLKLDEVLTRTTHEVGRFLRVDRCYITSYLPKHDKFQILHEYRACESVSSISSNEIAPINMTNDLKRWVMDQWKVIAIDNVEDYQGEPAFTEFLSNFGIKSMVSVPLVHHNELLGTITIHQSSYVRAWTENEIELLRDIAQQVSIAIRQAKLYAEAQKATRLKSEFLANMSHELRTPLNAIIGFSEMIQSQNFGQLNAKQESYIQNVIKSSRHLLTLVNDVLDLSKVESGSMELHYELFELSSIMREAISVIDGIACRKNIRTELKIHPGVHYAYADSARFRQILYNLLSNAVKFTREGGKVTLNAYLMPDHPKMLVVEVIDTGIGISEEDREMVFSVFQQIDGSYSRIQEGSGLGLALTQKLVRLHGGDIDFVSRVGAGTTFTFSLPCHIGGSLPMTPQLQEAPSTQDGSSLNRIRMSDEDFSPHLLSGADLSEAELWKIQMSSLQPTGIQAKNIETRNPNNKAHSRLMFLMQTRERQHLVEQHFQKTAHRVHFAQSPFEAFRKLENPGDIDLMVMDLGLFKGEDQTVSGAKVLLNRVKSHARWSRLPLLFVEPDVKSSSIHSLGVIDYLVLPTAQSVIAAHLENIKHNIVKEESLNIFIYGSQTLTRLFTADLLTQYQIRLSSVAREGQHVGRSRVSEDPFEVARAMAPTLILVEVENLFEPWLFAFLERLKSSIETKYIPVILVESKGSLAQTESTLPLRDGLEPWREALEVISLPGGGTMRLPLSQSLSVQTLSSDPLNDRCGLVQPGCRGNLLKDIEYALRIAGWEKVAL